MDVDAAVAARVLALEAEHKVKLSLLQTALEEEVDLLKGENRRLREELQSEARLNEDLEKVRGASAGGPTAASGGRLPAGRDISRTRGRPGAGSGRVSLRPDEPPAAAAVAPSTGPHGQGVQPGPCPPELCGVPNPQVFLLAVGRLSFMFTSTVMIATLNPLLISTFVFSWGCPLLYFLFTLGHSPCFPVCQLFLDWILDIVESLDSVMFC